MRRMDRYQGDNELPSRIDINQELYQNFSNNTIYTNVTDVVNANAYDISNISSETTREAYQKMQKYQNMEEVPETKKELEDYNYLYQRRENKVYDINSVLEEARKNRQEKDEKDEKRRLKNNEYNILAGINQADLEKYREEKKKRKMTPEEEEIRELIDTIASKTLAGEIDKATSVDLLSDLMATSMMDKVEASEELPEENKEDQKELERTSEEPTITATFETTLTQDNTIEDTKEEPTKDPDFYTKSMDLSDRDFNTSDDFKENQLPLPVKILIFLVILSLVALTIFFVIQRFQ